MTDQDKAGRQGRTYHTGNLAAEMCRLHTAAEPAQGHLPGMPAEGPQGQVGPGDGSMVMNRTTQSLRHMARDQKKLRQQLVSSQIPPTKS